MVDHSDELRIGESKSWYRNISIFLALFGFLGFYISLNPTESKDTIMGFLGLFLGIVGVVMLIIFETKGIPFLLISQMGIKISYSKNKTLDIPWHYIDGIGEVELYGQSHTGIRLKNLEPLVNILRKEDISKISFLVKGVKIATIVASSLDIIEDDTIKNAFEDLPKTSELNQYKSYLLKIRNKYGYDIFLNQTLRDRDAQSFAFFLTQMKQKFKS